MKVSSKPLYKYDEFRFGWSQKIDISMDCILPKLVFCLRPLNSLWFLMSEIHIPVSLSSCIFWLEIFVVFC